MNIIDTILASVISSLLVLLPAPSGAPLASTTLESEGEAMSLVLEFRNALERWREDHSAHDAERIADSGSHTEDDRAEDSSSDDDGDVARAPVALQGESRSNKEKAYRTEDGEHRSRESGDDDDERYEDEESDDDDEHRSTPAPRVSAPVASSLPAATAQHTTSVQPHSFTMTEVKAHSSAASCYTVVHGVVYDVSSWIGKHPGGQGAIKGMCGVDATSSFDGQHGGSARPESELAQFKIGTLTR